MSKPVSKKPHGILVIGCGSIGERHIRNFLDTGRASVVACDDRPDICRQMSARYGVESVADWSTALNRPDITGVAVATPAPSHVEIALRALESGRHVLIEKPLALSLDGVDRLLAARNRMERFAAVAYTLHCLPTLQAGRDFIRSGVFGPVRHATVTAGQHFPSFRPAYRDIYYRDHAQGGGAIQDALTHVANAVEWVLGAASRVYCDAAHQVLEGVEVEDTVNVAARHHGALVSYALNQFQAPNETCWSFHAQTGSVRIELNAQRWGTLRHGETEWTWHAAPLENRDVLVRAQSHAFLDGCEGRPQPLCTLEEGIQTLRFNLAALASWRQGRPVAP